jgi:L-arabinokinase
VRRPIVYYVTAHGYGHGVRSCDILRALRVRCPEAPITVVSALPEAFFRSRLGGADVALRPASFDVGMIQRDGIRIDEPATVRALEAMLTRRPADEKTETAFLESVRPAVVVADIPGLPLAAAAERGIPAVAVGNFAWDWIYDEYADSGPVWRAAAERFRRDYGRADRLLELPFACPMTAFRVREPIPLVSSPGRNRREEMAAALGIPTGRRWCLLAFTALDWVPGALERLGATEGFAFLYMEPAQWRGANLYGVPRDRFAFPDVVATVDVVLSKPGYGIVSDCVVNQTPLVYAERTGFREYDVLVAAIRRYVRNAHVPSEQLYRGEVAGALNAAIASPAPVERLSAGGAPVAADRIAAAAEGP